MAENVTKNYTNSQDWWKDFYSRKKNTTNSLTTPTSWLKTPVSNPNPVWRPPIDFSQNQYQNSYMKTQGWQEMIWSPGLQTPVVNKETVQWAWLKVLWEWQVNNDVLKANFNALNNSYWDFFKKNINTNPSLQSTIQNSFNQWDPEYDYKNIKTFLDNVNANIPVFSTWSSDAKYLYQKLIDDNKNDLGKKLLLDKYLESQNVNVNALKQWTKTTTSPQAITQNKPAQNQIIQPATNDNKQWLTDISKVDTNISSTTSTDTTTTPTQTPQFDLTWELDKYKANVEKEKQDAINRANKYWVNVEQIDSYYKKSLEDYTNWITKAKNSMDTAFDWLIKDSRNFNADQIELFWNIKKAALEDARIKWDKDLADKEKYYNEIDRSLKIQKIRNRANDVIAQQSAMALWTAVWERFWTWSVRYYNDAVRESDLMLSQIEDKLLENQNLKVKDLANIRAEYNNAQEKINNAFLANTQQANKAMMDTINSVILQKWKSSQDTLQQIKTAKDNYINALAWLQDKRYQENKELTNQLMQIDQDYNKIALSVTQQALEAQQAWQKSVLDYIKQTWTWTWNWVTWPLTTWQVESVISLVWWSKLSDDEKKSKVIQIQEMANNWISLDDIKLLLPKNIYIKDKNIVNMLKGNFSNRFVKDLSNMSQKINNWDIPGWLKSFENDVYVNAFKELWKDATSWLNPVQAKVYYREVDKIKEQLNKMWKTEKSALWLTYTPEMFKSDERQQLDSMIQSLLSDLIKEKSWSAASEQEVDRLKNALWAWKWRSSDDLVKTLENEKNDILFNMNAQRELFELPKIDQDYLSNKDSSFNYATLYYNKK